MNKGFNTTMRNTMPPKLNNRGLTRTSYKHNKKTKLHNSTFVVSKLFSKTKKCLNPFQSVSGNVLNVNECGRGRETIFSTSPSNIMGKDDQYENNISDDSLTTRHAKNQTSKIMQLCLRIEQSENYCPTSMKQALRKITCLKSYMKQVLYHNYFGLYDAIDLSATRKWVEMILPIIPNSKAVPMALLCKVVFFLGMKIHCDIHFEDENHHGLDLVAEIEPMCSKQDVLLLEKYILEELEYNLRLVPSLNPDIMVDDIV